MEKSPNSAEPVKRRGAPKKVLNAGMIQIMAMKGLTQEDIAAGAEILLHAMLERAAGL